MSKMDDIISRQAAIDALDCGNEWNVIGLTVIDKDDAIRQIKALPSAQPTEASCWGCNCPKMERLNEQKTFSEMVHLHDAETHDKRTETHACDLISRQWLMECVDEGWIKFDTAKDENRFIHLVRDIAPSAQPERVQSYWRLSDYQNEVDVANGNYSYICAYCNHSDIHAKTAIVPYCWHCGAEMRGGQDD